MALMRAQIDKRTLAGLTTLDNVTFAHGLGGTPDAVIIRWIVSNATATSWYGANAVIDATNVTINNPGNATSPNMEVCTIRFHSIIQ
jgi:hypothetical protein